VQFVSHSESKEVSLSKESQEELLTRRPKWADKEYRESYMDASIDQGIAWQIRINRETRGMTQKALAAHLGTKQSAISRLEDPEYGAHSIDTLKQIAKGFDCALSIRFISYTELAELSDQLSVTDQYASPFALEIEKKHD
jgi:transcriptional regulator with XRE-family HTH domain